MAIIAGIWEFVSGTWIGRVLAGLLVTMLALAIYTGWVDDHAQQTATVMVETRVAKATTTESDRRLAVMQQVQQETVAQLNTVIGQQKKDAARLKEIDDASRANDRHACLDAAGVQRLDAVGR